MDTNKLIDQLATELKPVKRLHRPPFRAALMCLWAFALVVIFIPLLGGLRPDWKGVIHTLHFQTDTGLILIAAVLSTFAAFSLSIPDTRIRPVIYILLGAATLIWACLSFMCFFETQEHSFLDELMHAKTGHICVLDLAALMTLPLVVIFVMISRASSVWHGYAGYGMVLSIASFGAFGMRLLCPLDDHAHLFIWHFLPVALFAVIGIFLGKLLLHAKIFKKN